MSTLWIIDGYNFIRQSRRFSELEAHDGIRGQVAALNWLARFQKETGERVRVVFDAYSGLHREPVVEQKLGVEIWLSRGGYTADEEILSLAHSMGQGCIVISSDREVSRGAVRSGASVLDSEEFEREVSRIFAGIDEKEEDLPKRSFKGRAFHPPKEKKKPLQILRKYP